MLSEIKKIHDRMKKNGMAEIIVEVAGYPNDDEFEGKPPTCKITVSAKDPLDPSRTYPSEGKEFARRTDRDDRKFLVAAETVSEGIVSALKRFFKKEKRRSLDITVTAEPISGWEPYYESSTRTVQAEAGKTVLVTVSLKPKPARLDHRLVLNKSPGPPKKSE